MKQVCGDWTYYRPLEGLRTLLEYFQGFALIRGTFYDGFNARLANILQNSLELVRRWWIFGDVQLELGAVRGSLRRVVAGLVFGRSFGGIGRCLLEEVGNSDGGGRAGLVEEGDNVFRLVLKMGRSN